MAEDKLLSPKESDKFLETAPREIPRLPRVVEHLDPVTRASSFGALFGIVDYSVLPDLFHVSRQGFQDEVSALYAVAAGVLLGTVTGIQQLCSEVPEVKAQRKFNLLKGAGSGLFSGLSIANVTPWAILSAADGGIILTATVLGMGGIALYNYLKRPKYCQKPDCGRKGNCKQRVCRYCYHLFVPQQEKIDCSQAIGLNWYAIASFLHYQGLSYLDAEVLVRAHLSAWKAIPYGSSFVIDCESFTKWVSENKAKILRYIDEGKSNKSRDEILEYLHEKGL